MAGRFQPSERRSRDCTRIAFSGLRTRRRICPRPVIPEIARGMLCKAISTRADLADYRYLLKRRMTKQFLAHGATRVAIRLDFASTRQWASCSAAVIRLRPLRSQGWPMTTNPTGLPRYLRTPDAAKVVGLSIRTLEKRRIYDTGHALFETRRRRLFDRRSSRMLKNSIYAVVLV
jgi:hypothetical protein